MKKDIYVIMYIGHDEEPLAYCTTKKEVKEFIKTTKTYLENQGYEKVKVKEDYDWITFTFLQNSIDDPCKKKGYETYSFKKAKMTCFIMTVEHSSKFNGGDVGDIFEIDED